MQHLSIAHSKLSAYPLPSNHSHRRTHLARRSRGRPCRTVSATTFSMTPTAGRVPKNRTNAPNPATTPCKASFHTATPTPCRTAPTAIFPSPDTAPSTLKANRLASRTATMERRVSAPVQQRPSLHRPSPVRQTLNPCLAPAHLIPLHSAFPSAFPST